MLFVIFADSTRIHFALHSSPFHNSSPTNCNMGTQFEGVHMRPSLEIKLNKNKDGARSALYAMGAG